MKQIAVSILLAALISGCGLFTSHPSRTGEPPRNGIAKADGKAFYLFRAGYKCGSPMPDIMLLASWVDKIEIVEGRLVRWGSRCGGQGLPLPEDERRSARISADGATLTLLGVTYRQSADPIKEAEARP